MEVRMSYADDEEFDRATLEDINRSIQEVKEAVKDKWNSVQLIFVVLIGIAAWDWAGNVWHSKWRYATEYSIDSAKVVVGKEPHDCAFLAAPLGTKYCHYDREVSTLRWATSKEGYPIVSYDEGKTWSTFTPEASASVPKTATVEQVFVGWKKIEE
jgi:hypothetical protein